VKLGINDRRTASGIRDKAGAARASAGAVAVSSALYHDIAGGGGARAWHRALALYGRAAWHLYRLQTFPRYRRGPSRKKRRLFRRRAVRR